MCVCVCPAAAGRLGSRCDWWHLRGRQQQIQTDGFRLCQVRVCVSPPRYLWLYFYNTVLGRDVGCVCLHSCVIGIYCCPCGVCPVWECVSLCLQRLPSVCLSDWTICQLGRIFSSSLLLLVLLLWVDFVWVLWVFMQKDIQKVEPTLNFLTHNTMLCGENNFSLLNIIWI